MSRPEQSVRPLRVGLIVRWPTGGIRTHIKYLYANLPAGKYQPVLVAPTGMEADLLLDNLSRWNPESIQVATPGVVAFAASAWRTILMKRLDVIHSHGFTSAGIAGLPARVAGLPHIATIHDVITEALEHRLGRSGLAALRVGVEQANVVHAVGKDAGANLAEKLLSRNYANSRLRVIRNGIDLGQFTAVTPRPLRADLRLPDDVLVIGFMGRFMAQKGFGTLIDAATALRAEGTPRPFMIVAIGDGGFIREDRTEITSRGLDGHFIFLPSVENSAPTMAALDCLVMPSRWEAFSVLACEALCLGVPLIASDCIGLREAVAGTPARVFAAGDAQALAAAIRDEMEFPRGARARDFIPEARMHFDVSRTAAQIDHLFDEVLAGTRRDKR